ncbi:hypothetical protein ACQJBY_067153 [Aegilops geniculata]
MSRRGRRRRRLNRIARAAIRSMAAWADLPPDLLRDVSGRLHNAADFTRFHAVCTAWRDALPRPPCAPPVFLPWLLTRIPCKGTPTACEGRLILHSAVNFSPERTPRSKYSDEGIFLVRPPGESSPRNWLTSTDGTAAWLLTTDTGAGLHPFTGAFTPLPAYQDEQRRMENPRGSTCCDGTVFLYNIFSSRSPGKLVFRAAVLRPGDTAWTLMKTKLDHLPNITNYGGSGITALYHNGKILVCLGLHWCILTLEDGGATRRLEPMPWIDKGGGCQRKTCYALEFQGELLLVTVLLHVSHTRETPMLSLVVHAWDEDKMQWLRRDGRSLGDGVLFLGSRASYAVDAAQLGLDGGCAYFIFNSNYPFLDVFRYNFMNNEAEAKLVEHLHWAWPAHNTRDAYWLQLPPTIAPIQEIRKRLGLEKPHPRDNFVCERYVGRCLTITACCKACIIAGHFM